MRLDEERRAKLKEKLEQYFGGDVLYANDWQNLFSDLEDIL
jgi:nitrogen fixation protein